MKVGSKISLTFCLAGVFLLAVEVSAFHVIAQLNLYLHDLSRDQSQAAQVADAIRSCRVAPLRENDHLAEIKDLESVATDQELALLRNAEAALTAHQPVDQAVEQLEALGALYRDQIRAVEKQLLDIHHLVVAGLIVIMAISTLLFILLTSVVRSWLLRPLTILARGAGEVAEGKTGRQVSLIGGEEFATIAGTINKMGKELFQVRADAEQNQRLAIVGQACSHVTHNVRTLLGSIRSLAQYESNATDVEPNSRVGFNYIIALVNKLDTWVRDIHQTITPASTSRAAHHIEPLVHDIVQLLEPRITEKNLTIDYQESEDLTRALIDRALFEQAFVAVLSNALEASPDNGHIGVKLQNDGAGRVAVVIEDAGPGMNEETKQRVLDAFFTTKPEHAGLGLTIAQSIVKLHEGEIAIDSAPGKGTRVTLFFQAAKAR